MYEEKESADWYRYRNTSTRHLDTQTGDAAEPTGLPAPPVTRVERRLADTPGKERQDGPISGFGRNSASFWFAR